jgi:hyperosmotically inducible periplasmic protein
MKINKALTLAGAALIVVTSVDAWSQTSSAPMGSDMEASSSMATPQSTKKQDRMLSRKVRAALSKDKTITPSGIVVRAKNGAVILEGTVPDESQIERATNVAQHVQGVTSVKNSLSIREEGE